MWKEDRKKEREKKKERKRKRNWRVRRLFAAQLFIT